MKVNNMEKEEKDPLLIFITKVSRCANGYHLKIRKKDVELLKIAGDMVRVKVYNIESDTDSETKDPYDILVE